METLNMEGPYDLDKENIDNEITKTSAGNYALGYKDDKGGFAVCYVGRSDSDVKDRLMKHLDDKKKYTSFKFSYASSPKEAYEKECRNYHEWGGCKGLENIIHPDSPNGITRKCPVCGQ